MVILDKAWDDSAAVGKDVKGSGRREVCGPIDVLLLNLQLSLTNFDRLWQILRMWTILFHFVLHGALNALVCFCT